MKLTEPETKRELDESQIHNVLRNERRRETIRYLRQAGDSLAVDDLAEHIATLETGETPPPRNVRKSVYVSLHQTHLPKLDDLGIVEYDQRSKELLLKDRAREVEVYMEVVPQTRRFVGDVLPRSGTVGVRRPVRGQTQPLFDPTARFRVLDVVLSDVLPRLGSVPHLQRAGAVAVLTTVPSEKGRTFNRCTAGRRRMLSRSVGTPSPRFC